jgi:hypothetical protein
MKIIRIENQHDDFEGDFVVVHCWKEKFEYSKANIDLFRISNAFRSQKQRNVNN